MMICCEFVAILLLVTGEMSYLGLTFTTQSHANRGEQFEHDILLEVMALDKEISIVGGYAQFLKLGLHSFEIGSGMRIAARKPSTFLLYAESELLKSLFGVRYAYGVEAHYAAEVLHGEWRKIALAVKPYIPQEERIDNLRVEAEEGSKVDERSIVESALHAHTVQTFGIALEVLDGIGVGMKHIGALNDTVRSTRCALQQVVVIAINAGYHMATKTLAKVVHHRHLLTLGKGGIGGQHYLKVVTLGIILAQQMTPKRHIIVALHVGYNALTCTLGAQTIGSADIE